MSHSRDLKLLAELSGIAFDARMAPLRQSAMARSATLAALARLSDAEAAALVPQAEPTALAASAEAEMLYGKWVAQQRARLNIRLAAETARWLTERDNAQVAFGRRETLTALSAAAAAKARHDRRRKADPS